MPPLQLIDFHANSTGVHYAPARECFFLLIIGPKQISQFIENPWPQSLFLHSIRCQVSCAKPFLVWLVAIYRCMCLWYKKKQSKYSVQIFFFIYLIYEYLSLKEPPTRLPAHTPFQSTKKKKKRVKVNVSYWTSYGTTLWHISAFPMLLCTFRIALKSRDASQVLWREPACISATTPPR